MEYRKTPIEISEQIKKLEKRGLLFNNKQNAEKILSTISYYRLRAYTFPFQDNSNPNHPFSISKTFEEIISLYSFDSKLRLIIFEATEQIEIALRTNIIHKMAINYGSHWHTKESLYRNSDLFKKHISSLREEIDRSSEVFISHYKEKYCNPTDPPCWMSLEVASMGLLSKLFANLKLGKEKREILKYFGLKKIKILENWIHLFTTLRNICAHHGRTWNRRLKPISLPNRTDDIFITNKSIKTNKLYAYICCIQYILNRIDTQNDFSIRIKNLLENNKEVNLNEMGFPKDWSCETFWNQ